MLFYEFKHDKFIFFSYVNKSIVNPDNPFFAKPVTGAELVFFNVHILIDPEVSIHCGRPV